jgi:hypothetical protein
MHFAYYPIMPGDNFTTDVFVGEEINGSLKLVAPEGVELISEAEQTVAEGKASWKLKAEQEGSYILEYWYGDESYAKDLLVTSEKSYEVPVKNLKRKDIKSIAINHGPVKIINLHFRGWKLGWIGTYIIFSIIFSMLIRKWLKIY